MPGVVPPEAASIIFGVPPLGLSALVFFGDGPVVVVVVGPGLEFDDWLPSACNAMLVTAALLATPAAPVMSWPRNSVVISWP